MLKFDSSTGLRGKNSGNNKGGHLFSIISESMTTLLIIRY